MTPPSQRTVALLGLVLLAILLAASSDVQGDCRDCCSPNGTCERAFRHREGICCGILASRPYCCPTNSRCIQKSNTRFSCKLKNNAGKIGDPVSNPPIDRGSDDSRWCGPDCQLGWIVALCILIPCCCCIAFGYHLRRRSLAAANAEYAGGVHAPATYGQPAASPQAGFMGAVGPIFSSWFGGPAPSRPLTPPRDYSAGEPRVPPNSPEGAATGAYPGMAYPPKEQLRGYSGETQAPGMWTGEPHKLSEGEQQLEKQQQHEYKSNGPHRPQPTYAGPPPSHSGVYPTAAADAPSSSSFASEAHHPVAAPIRRTDHEEHAPGGAPVPVETSREPPPPYVP